MNALFGIQRIPLAALENLFAVSLSKSTVMRSSKTVAITLFPDNGPFSGNCQSCVLRSHFTAGSLTTHRCTISAAGFHIFTSSCRAAVSFHQSLYRRVRASHLSQVRAIGLAVIPAVVPAVSAIISEWGLLVETPATDRAAERQRLEPLIMLRYFPELCPVVSYRGGFP